MPRHFYPPEQKAAAIERLNANGGNIALTHLQTGIPLRTLYGWRQAAWLQQLQRIQQSSRSEQQRTPPPSPPPITDLTGAPDIRDELLSEDDNLKILNRIRLRMINELADLADEGLKLTSPYQRIQALTTLLDRLMKLDEHLQPYLPAEQVTRIEFVYPDGSKHNVPPWAREAETVEDSSGESQGRAGVVSPANEQRLTED